MPVLYLHGGAPKTGSSYLQVLFAQNEGPMREAGLVYPKGRKSNDALKGKITSGNGLELSKFIRPNLRPKFVMPEDYPVQLEAQIKAADGKNILYSSEFLRCPNNDSTNTLKSLASKYGYTIRYILFVRHIGSAAFSSYSQNVKNHSESNALIDFLKKWDPLYKKTLAEAVSSFGKDAVLVYNYDEQRPHLARFVFRDILKLDFTPKFNKTVNRSLNIDEIELLRTINKFSGGDRNATLFATRALMDTNMPKQPFNYLKEEVDVMRKRFTGQMDYVNQFITGEQIHIAKNIVEERQGAALTPRETALAAIITRLAVKIFV